MNTTFQFYNTVTQEYGRETSGPYLLDGQPGPMPPDTVELSVIRTDAPEATPGKITVQVPVLDLAAKTLTYAWELWDIPVPSVISIKQMMLWIVDAGLYEAYEAAFAAIPDPTERLKAEIHRKRSHNIERNHPMTLFIATALGMSSQEIDDAFIEASQISI